MLVAVLTELSGSRPTVLVLEDVHWADDAPLDVLRYVGRRVDELAAVIVATFRDGEVGRSLQGVLGGFGGPSVRRLPLARLSRPAVARLAEAQILQACATAWFTTDRIADALAASTAAVEIREQLGIPARWRRRRRGSPRSCGPLTAPARSGGHVRAGRQPARRRRRHRTPGRCATTACR